MITPSNVVSANEMHVPALLPSKRASPPSSGARRVKLNSFSVIACAKKKIKKKVKIILAFTSTFQPYSKKIL